MKKGTAVMLFLCAMIFIIPIALIWQSMIWETSIIHEDTIKVSSVHSWVDPVFLFQETDVETIGGDVIHFWGDLSDQILPGEKYAIQYQLEYRLWFFANRFNLLKVEFLGGFEP